MEFWTVIAFFILFALSLLLLLQKGLLHNTRTVILVAVFLLIALLLRGLCMHYETLDYLNFLSRWVQFFRDNGGFAALSESVGNYNLPYLYFLAAFSYLQADDLLLIKLLSILFDFILAWGLMELVGCVTSSENKRLFTFLAVPLLPTVLLNGALWGQCDSIYVALAVWGICLALKGRPVLSVIFAALSFAFKLQAVFLLPIYAVFLFTHHVRWRHLLLFPLTYLVVVSPAVLLGRPLLDTLTLYFNQAGSVGSGLNYNSPSVFALISGEVDTALYSKLGIGGAFAALLLLLFWLRRRRGRLSGEAIVCASLLMAVMIPFLLPHMHDRYFFGADVLSLAFAVILPRFFAVPVCVSFASLLGYHAYLKMQYLLPMRYGSVALIFAMLLILIHLAFLLQPLQKRRSQA